MKNNRFISAILSILLPALICCSCDKQMDDNDYNGNYSNQSIKANVSSLSYYTETKSSSDYVLNAVYGDDDFSISEYVSDITDEILTPVTKGTEMTTAGIKSTGKSFTVDGWGMISPERGKPQEITHWMDNLTATYNSTGTDHWPWAGGANPKWINGKLHLWSYYPAGEIEPDIDIDDTTPANNKAEFSYTTDNTDLLIAYNGEKREFKKDAQGNHTYNNNGEITNDIIGSDSFNVHFYHALAAVKFKLTTNTSGADIHSITFCHTTTSGTTKTVVTNAGIATTGDCTVTGPSLSSSNSTNGTTGVEWSNLSDKKPLHCVYSSGQSVKSGYALDGEGVLFMIPQKVENLTCIVEFSKNGGTQYYTRVYENPLTVDWMAGKCYTYEFEIGEFHVPGEPMLGSVDLIAEDFKFPATREPKIINKDINIKDVTKIGLIMDGYTYKDNGAATLVISLAPNGVAERYVADVESGGQEDFTYNFAEATFPAPTVNQKGEITGSNIDLNTIYSFGVPATEETYHRYYKYLGSPTGFSSTDTEYFVFKTEGCTSFNIGVVCTSENNSAKFTAHVRGIMVLEVKNDKLPDNFYTVAWP